MNRYLKSLFVAGALGAPIVGFTADSDVASRLADLEALVRSQQAELAALRGSVDAQADRLDGSIAAALEQVGYAQSKDAPILKLGRNSKGLEFTGDIRVRYEIIERDLTDANRDHWRQRVRVGFKWDVADDIEVGIGLATGGTDATSTNQTYSSTNAFSTDNINLDYAYGKLKWDLEGDKASLTLGQMKNPFTTSWLFMDSDVRPVGLVGSYAMENGFFAHLGMFDVRDTGAGQANVYMLGSQFGFNGKVGSDGKYTVAAAYFHTNSAAREAAAPATVADYNYELLDLYAEYSQKINDDLSMKLYADYFTNLGAEGGMDESQLGADHDAGNDQGFLVGVDGKYGKFSAGYAYARVESDSVWAILKDGDFGRSGGMRTSTDVKGHVFKLGYSITKALSVGFTAMALESIDGPAYSSELYQLDTIFTF